jgi:3-isopropylmalate/(R)-2-methylmalate dehydratase large subunit
MMHVMATQMIWQRSPRTLRIRSTEKLGAGVAAKDVILAIIGKIGVAGGVGHVIEYAGSTFVSMSMEARMTCATCRSRPVRAPA